MSKVASRHLNRRFQTQEHVQGQEVGHGVPLEPQGSKLEGDLIKAKLLSAPKYGIFRTLNIVHHLPRELVRDQVGDLGEPLEPQRSEIEAIVIKAKMLSAPKYLI